MKREGIHLLEIWARLPDMSEQQYATRLSYLTKIGTDIHKYRHRDESSIVMLVVGACKGEDDFGNLFTKLRVLVAAHADFFWQLDERSRTAMWKVRDMVRYVKRCMQVRLESDEPSICWNEVIQFE